jgi:hypothetical protein
VLLLTNVGTAQVEYELVIVEPWDTSYSLAASSGAGLNNLNQVSGGANPLPGGTSSFLWTRELGKTPVNLAGAINDQGVILSGDTIRWPDGTLQWLDSTYRFTSGRDLNNANVAVEGAPGCGSGTPPPGTPINGNQIWDPIHGMRSMWEDFGIPSIRVATAINNRNEMVGMQSTLSCGDHKAFYYGIDTGEYVNLHTEFVGSSSGITEAYDINDHGVVVGEGPSGGTVRPFLWNRTDGFTLLPSAPNSTLMDTHFQSINNHGHVVGDAIVNNQEWHAMIWDPAQGVRDLNDLVVLPADFVVDRAKKINDNGWIMGSGHYGVWSPERLVVLIPLGQANGGDFDDNGLLDLADVDALVGEIVVGTNSLMFDLTGDSQVDELDLSRWLLVAGQSNLPSQGTYLSGDANLDGVVDGSDFNEWNRHKFTATSAWSRGDFNADGFTDGSDFNIWNTNKFTAADGSTMVPEPISIGLAIMGFFVSSIRALRRT